MEETAVAPDEETVSQSEAPVFISRAVERVLAKGKTLNVQPEKPGCKPGSNEEMIRSHLPQGVEYTPLKGGRLKIVSGPEDGSFRFVEISMPSLVVCDRREGEAERGDEVNRFVGSLGFVTLDKWTSGDTVNSIQNRRQPAYLLSPIVFFQRKSDGACLDLGDLYSEIVGKEKIITFAQVVNGYRGGWTKGGCKENTNGKVYCVMHEIPQNIEQIFTLAHEFGHALIFSSRPPGEFDGIIESLRKSRSRGGKPNTRLVVGSERDAWACAYWLLKALRSNGFIEFEDSQFKTFLEAKLMSYEIGFTGASGRDGTEEFFTRSIRKFARMSAKAKVKRGLE